MIFGAIQVAGGFMVGIAWYKLWRRRKDGIDTVEDGKVVVGDAEVGGRDKKDYLVWFRSLASRRRGRPHRLYGRGA